MTEAEWLVSTNPYWMLESIQSKASQRKFWLFAAAYCRRVWSLTKDDYCDRIVRALESFAEGTGSERPNRPVAPDEPIGLLDREDDLALAVVTDYIEDCANASDGWAAADFVVRATNRVCYEVDERPIQAELLREILGNAFRPQSCNPRWTDWNVGAIPKLTQAIYDERAFDRLPILADALEEAGCTNADILNHCRGAGEHVRGCWVVDLLLGKE